MPNLLPKKQITPAELAAARRVASHLKRVAVPFLADIFADEFDEARNSIEKPKVEFFIIFYRQFVTRFNLELVWAIRNFAAGKITADELKAVCDLFIKAHTVVWLGGVPYWKVKEIED